LQLLAAQVPRVAPTATSQARPLQQSAATVHTALTGWQTSAAAQTPAAQMEEQHEAEVPQAIPVAVHSAPASLPGTIPPSRGAPPSSPPPPPPSVNGLQAP
jgi:hypothetical protein